VPRPQQSIDDIPSRRSFLEWWRSGDTAGDYWQSVSSRNGNHSAYLGYAHATGLRINHPSWGATIAEEAFIEDTYRDNRFSAGISVINADAGLIQYRGQGVHSSWNADVVRARANLDVNVGWVEQPDGSRNLEARADAGIYVSALSAGYNFNIPFTGINVGFSGHLVTFGAYATVDLNREIEVKVAKFVGASIRVTWRGDN